MPVATSRVRDLRHGTAAAPADGDHEPHRCPQRPSRRAAARQRRHRRAEARSRHGTDPRLSFHDPRAHRHPLYATAPKNDGGEKYRSSPTEVASGASSEAPAAAPLREKGQRPFERSRAAASRRRSPAAPRGPASSSCSFAGRAGRRSTAIAIRARAREPRGGGGARPAGRADHDQGRARRARPPSGSPIAWASSRSSASWSATNCSSGVTGEGARARPCRARRASRRGQRRRGQVPVAGAAGGAAG